MRLKFGLYWRFLAKYLRPQLVQVVLLGILLMSSIGLQLVNPQVIRFFIDTAQKGESLNVLLMAAMIFLGVALLQQVIDVFAKYVSQNLGWTSTNALRTDLAAHCLKLDMSFHKTQRPGDLIEKIDGDVTAMFNFFSNLLIEVVSHFLLMAGVMVFLFLEDWRIGLVMTIFVCISMIVMSKIHSYAVPKYVDFRKIVTNFYGFVGELLTGKEDVLSNGAVEKVMDQLRGILKKWLPGQFKAIMASRAMWASTMAIFAVGNTLAFGVGGFLWSKGIITIGTVYLIFHYNKMLSMPLSQIQRQLIDLQKAEASIKRIEELLKIQPKIIDGKGPGLKAGPLAVKINNLTFEYEEGIPVLKDLSLKLAPGKILGVLGRTGSGKTTLARLLTRFYDISQGEILLNNQAIQSIPLDDLRKKIAFVTQEVQLFNASVRDNLTFYNPEINDAKIWQVLEEIGLDRWVKELPDGLDTILASDGGGLSAGEAQLLAFVRVFLKNPGLIILDEASSRLDPMTEQLMEKAIKKLFENRTGIIIAHRLQTVERADEILILDQGKILEYGKRDELAKDKNSYFYRLLQKGIEEVLA